MGPRIHFSRGFTGPHCPRCFSMPSPRRATFLAAQCSRLRWYRWGREITSFEALQALTALAASRCPPCLPYCSILDGSRNRWGRGFTSLEAPQASLPSLPSLLLFALAAFLAARGLTSLEAPQANTALSLPSLPLFALAAFLAARDFTSLEAPQANTALAALAASLCPPCLSCCSRVHFSRWLRGCTSFEASLALTALTSPPSLSLVSMPSLPSFLLSAFFCLEVARRASGSRVALAEKKLA